jgi:hypothetical protein
MKKQNENEAGVPGTQTDFLPSGAATCYAIFRRYHWNARTVIRQIRAGEWEFRYNQAASDCFVATRNGREIWVGNGGCFCDLRSGPPAFGLIFRHWVWHAAARKARNSAKAAHIPRMDSKPPSSHNVEVMRGGLMPETN